jgi:cell division septum initiation protein DivIVA
MAQELYLKTEEMPDHEESELADLIHAQTYDDRVPLSPQEITVFIDELVDLVSTGLSVPFTSRALIDRGQCLDTLELLRANMPWEMLEAKRILSEEDRVLERAETEAEQIRQQAERQAAFILDQSQLVKAAETRAQEVMEAADAEAARIVRLAQKDARDLYHSLAEELDLLVRDIKTLMASRFKVLGE